jgi:hypothetical protein
MGMKTLKLLQLTQAALKLLQLIQFIGDCVKGKQVLSLVMVYNNSIGQRSFSFVC